VIRFEQVGKSFGRTVVLDGLDLEIERGDRIALVGSNGAGKTTLLRCLLGHYPCRGRVLVDGLEPRAHRREVLRRTGFVPQLPPLLKMQVGHLVEFAASTCGSDPAAMAGVAERLGLSMAEVRRRPFDKLSGGQKQKLLIGVALGRDCDLLVLDEPAANLDPEARQVFFELLAERKERAAMLLSSHRLDEVAALVNRVVELDRGCVVLDDAVADRVELDSRLDCRLRLDRSDESFARTAAEWGLRPAEGGLEWSGCIAGPDRLRFLGMLSRYAGLVCDVHLEERPPTMEVVNGEA
jgi:ABC-2 type transport system ATP-binding protein